MGVAEVFQRVEEVVVRHESELAEAGMGKTMQVTDYGLDEFLPCIGSRVLDLLLELDEVIIAPIELVSIEVMDVTLGVTRTVPDLPSSMMAEDAGLARVVYKIP